MITEPPTIRLWSAAFFLSFLSVLSSYTQRGHLDLYVMIEYFRRYSPIDFLYIERHLNFLNLILFQLQHNSFPFLSLYRALCLLDLQY